MNNASISLAFALLLAALSAGFALAQGAQNTDGGVTGGPGPYPSPGAYPSPARPTDAPTAGPGTPPRPPVTGQSGPALPDTVKGAAEQQTASATVGRSTPGPDGATTIVPARPCSRAARETDGFTTCVGIPPRRR
jgi:hypothetical protein